jgi:dimethylhistidine N-methyltransferase
MAGLSKRKKQIPSRYLYDARGAELFARLCDEDEHYLARTEASILEERAFDLGVLLGPHARVVELGACATGKSRALLAGLWRPAQYVFVGLSNEALARAVRSLGAEHRGLDVRSVCADYTQEVALPPCPAANRTVAYVPAAAIGRHAPDEARALLHRLRAMVGTDGAVVLGVDLPKAPAVLHAAYNDFRGATAAFNKNLLARVNRELFGRFDLDRFWHHAVYDPIEARVQMHLVSSTRQLVTVAGRTFGFDEGESITTEFAYKYSAHRFERLTAAAGFGVDRLWMGGRHALAVQLLSPRR